MPSSKAAPPPPRSRFKRNVFLQSQGPQSRVRWLRSQEWLPLLKNSTHCCLYLRTLDLQKWEENL